MECDIQKEYASYKERLVEARRVWETYTDRQSIEPVLALINVLKEPKLMDNPVIARQLLGATTTMTSRIKILPLKDEEKPYYNNLIPQDRFFDYGNKRNGYQKWCVDALRDLPNRETYNALVQALKYTYERRFNRWYVKRSCDDYKDTIIRILDDAIKDANIDKMEDL